MTESLTVAPLLEAVERYFTLMYDNDAVAVRPRLCADRAAPRMFATLNCGSLPAHDYRAMLASTPSPKSRDAPRLQEILLIDLASPVQALVKVRVRIDVRQYVDYLAYHCIKDAWLITREIVPCGATI